MSIQLKEYFVYSWVKSPRVESRRAQRTRSKLGKGGVGTERAHGAAKKLKRGHPRVFYSKSGRQRILVSRGGGGGVGCCPSPVRLSPTLAKRRQGWGTQVVDFCPGKVFRATGGPSAPFIPKSGCENPANRGMSMKRSHLALLASVAIFTALMSDVRPAGAQAPKAKESKPQQTQPGATRPATPWQCDKGGPPSVTVVGNSIYWVDFAGGNVWKIPVCGGNSTLIASKQSGPCSIIARDGHIYWTNNKSGEVMKAPVSGGPATVVSTGEVEPAEIAVSEDQVVWASKNGPRTIEGKTGTAVKATGDSNAGGGTNPGTVKCHVCPIYCRRWVPQIPNGYWETYICGWRSCPPCGA